MMDRIVAALSIGYLIGVLAGFFSYEWIKTRSCEQSLPRNQICHLIAVPQEPQQ